MADQKITDRPETTELPNDGVIHVVNVSDLSQSNDGSSYKITKENLLKNVLKINNLGVQGSVPYVSNNGGLESNSDLTWDGTQLLLENTNSVTNPAIQIGTNGRDVSTWGQGVTTAFLHDTANFNAFADMSIIDLATYEGTGYGAFDVSTKLIGQYALNHFFGYQCRMDYASSAAMPNNGIFGSMTGLWTQHRISSGSVYNATGFYYQDVVGSGDLTNQYAILIEPLSKGSNRNYGVYAVTDNYLKTVTSDLYTGNGSGLTNVDATTLDGLNSDEFKKTVVSSSISTNTDPNSVTIPSVTTNHTNTPDSNYFWHIETYFYASTSSNRYQVAKQNNGGSDMYVRRNENSIWSNWSKIYNDANDGSGSGLDADMVDGLQASELAVKALNNTFTGNNTFDEPLKLGVNTVSTLPTGTTGAIAYVTDASSISYRGTATGGGTETALVFFDGTNWIYH